ncbi:MAG: hypothetical protein JSS95_07585 [Acidobacteria bacterium]|nr:hypothetical protein [Acidobacteriota bacterium]
MGLENPNSISGELDAVHLKSGEPVDPSGPGLKESTLPPTAEQTPAAHLNSRHGALRHAGNTLQPKRGQEFEDGVLNSAAGAVPLSCFIDKRLIVTADDATTGDELCTANLFSRDRESGWSAT